MEKLEDILPELGRIFAHDLEKFKDDWFDVLYNYMAVFDKLFYIVGVENPDLEKSMAIFSHPDIDIVSEAEEVLEAFIQGKESREGLKYRLGRIVDQFQ
ncbi:hypothetical protein [Thermocrinis sp.]|jgi:hypothetical protein|uniref:hypothetical protein n=1 Tax=Thermocrinis sp. TaxID=2024383 RepID=UPI003C027C66